MRAPAEVAWIGVVKGFLAQCRLFVQWAAALIAAVTLIAVEGRSEALQITNVSSVNGSWDSNAGTFDLAFDITWLKSWRMSDGPSNWDAAWVFVKFKKNIVLCYGFP